MNTVEIKNSKIKVLMLLAGLILFLFLGIYLVIYPHKFVSMIFRNVTFITIAGAIASIFSLFSLIVLVKIIFTKKLGITINENGITDHSAYTSVGMVSWDDIVSIRKIDIASNKFLIINVKDPDKYIRTKSRTKQRLLKITLRNYGSPISISSNTLSCNFNELENIILKYYEDYKYRGLKNN